MQFFSNFLNQISSFDIKNHYVLVFTILAGVSSLYAVWREGRKDGFSEEKLFDNYILSIFVALLFSRIFYAVEARFLFGPFLQHVFYFWRAGFNIEGFILGFIAGAFALSFAYKWSLFRIFDIYALALSLGGSIFLAGMRLLVGDAVLYIPALILFLFYIIFSFLRLGKILSGLTFMVFLNLVVLLKEISTNFGSGGLIFNSTLVTIGLLTLIFRLRKNMKSKRNLPADIFSKLKDGLLKKNKRVASQQKLLDAEDPYLQAGRTEGNADEIDEAHLEDNFKTVVDAQKGVLGKVSDGVKRALGKMEKGEYGMCEKCGAPIDAARLEAYPEATLCSDCARKEE